MLGRYSTPRTHRCRRRAGDGVLQAFPSPERGRELRPAVSLVAAALPGAARAALDAGWACSSRCFVLLHAPRLSLAQIGVGMAAQGLVMLVLELPSGGLADALGRKPVLIVAGVSASWPSSLLLAVHSVALLAVAFAAQGIFRALDSGPLQAWFVDEALTSIPDVDIEHELSRGDVMICAASRRRRPVGQRHRPDGRRVRHRPARRPLRHRSSSWKSSDWSRLGHVDATSTAPGRAGQQRAVRWPRSPPCVRSAVEVIRASSLLTALVVAELLWGFGMVAFERFFPSRLAGS